ncbi:MAG: TetR/AcrR family transcriptional regulator [Treponemataceae bacterium]
MAIIVEHEKRKYEILNNALDLFIEEGYDAVTFQKIASRCNITRTTLYIYFKNKREIFMWSIKQFTKDIENELSKTILQKQFSSTVRLKKMFSYILDICKKNQRLLALILVYLLQLSKNGNDISSKIRRRLVRLRHLLSTIIIEGIDSGDIKKLNVKNINNLFYTIIESAIFRLATHQHENYNNLYSVFNSIVDEISVDTTNELR